jgi:methionine-rich copper-binding protein CopC
MTSPVLQSVTSSNNATIVLHFDRTISPGDASIVVSDGFFQTYVGSSGLATRLVGATDQRILAPENSSLSYSGQDLTITLSSALKNGLSYSVTMGMGSVIDADGHTDGNAAITSPKLFTFVASGSAATVATPSAAVASTLHFVDTGTNSSDFITATLDQTLTGTYTGTLGTNDFVQVSLDNGASWHKATLGANKSWSYSEDVNEDNLTEGASGILNGTLLARVSNTAGGSSATASHDYVYNNSPIEITVGNNFSFSADTGSSGSDRITKTASQTISGTYSGVLESGQTVQVSADNGVTWINASAANGTWSSNTKVTLLTGSDKQVQARVVDTAGNTSDVASASYKLITSTVSLSGHTLTLPSSTDTGVSASDGITQSASKVTLNVAGLRGFHAGDTIEIIDTSHSSVVVGSYVIQSSDLYYGDNYFTINQYNPTERNTVDINLNSLAVGAHTLAARIVDVAGNTATASGTTSVTIDNVAPVLSSSAPLEDAIDVSTGLTKLTFTFNENIAIANGTIVTISDDNNGNNLQEITLSSSAANGKTLTINLTSPLTAGTYYTVKGATIGDVAGNIGVTGDTPMLHFLTAGTSGGGSGVNAPVLGYSDTAPASDTNSSSAFHHDGITNNHHISVTGLDSQGQWYYRVTGSGDWLLGDGAGFDLEDGTYAMDQIEVKQIVAGVESNITPIHTPLIVDTTPSTAIVAATSVFSAGANNVNGVVSGSTDFSNEIVEVTFNHGASWTKASTTFIGSGAATWSLSGISGQLGDNFGLRLSDQAGNITSFVGLDQAQPFYYLASGGVTFNHGSDNYTAVSGGSGADTITLGNHALVFGGDNDTIHTGSDAIIAGDANLVVTTGNGHNVVTATSGANITTGSGEDIISISNATGAVVHAGGGADMLELSSLSTISLSALTGITGVDILNFGASGANHLTITTSASLHSFSDADQLIITASDAGSIVHLESFVWGAAGTQGSYSVYHNGQGSGAMTLLIGQNITVDMFTGTA